MQAPEHGQVIAELTFSEANVAYDAFGRAGAVPAWARTSAIALRRRTLGAST